MKRFLVTGGSGFIGINMVGDLLEENEKVLSIDIKPPQNKEHEKFFKKVDIRDFSLLDKTIQDFSPTHVIHLAARTDLLETKNIEGYNANTDGVKNLIESLNNLQNLERCIFTSSKLVCKNGYVPKSWDDYCADTMYGESKVIGEKIVKESDSINFEWCLTRPTSIWGPWFDIPYKGFFLSVAKGWYFHPGKLNPLKSFGYIGNTIYQYKKLLEAPTGKFHKQTFYITDYEDFTIRNWANRISREIHGKDARTLPDFFMFSAAKIGDFMKILGFKNPPVTSFRLDNMKMVTTGLPLENIMEITGNLPFTMENGVLETVKWLKKSNLIK